MSFEKELKRLSTRSQPGNTNSYKTVSSATQGPVDGDLPLHGLPQRPPGLSHHARGYREEENGGNLTSPIKIGDGVSVASTTEALRNLELPTLPAPNVEGASILFGDWLTMAFPLMSDISNSAKAWWEESLGVAQEHYTQWLTLTPLERIRKRPEVVAAPAFQRIEQRGIAMLLGALPDGIRRDLISGRQLSVAHILYRLHIAYQPGGGAEKTQLLKSLVEAKFTASITDLLTQV